MIPLDQRKGLVDTTDKRFSICRQCELLSINRSTLYYTPSKAPLSDLAIMRTMDELYIEDPTRGTRRMAKVLLHTYARGIYVNGCHNGPVQPVYCRLEFVKYHGSRMGCKYPYPSSNKIRQA